MEFIDLGCLRGFLNNLKKTASVDTVNTRRKFVLYGKQIAEGMSYLVSVLSARLEVVVLIQFPGYQTTAYLSKSIS